ncbi:MAG: VWA domain-containing protein, partial [Bryobacteraceae bacterium]
MHKIPLLLLSLGMALYGQQIVPPRLSSDQSLRTQGEEVIVDVIVLDKKGHSVNDLSQSEVSVFDNGTAHPVRSFLLIHGEEAATAGPSRAGGNPDSLRQMRLVTLIFDQMDLNARRLARQAALELLKQEFPRNVYMSVFRLDNRLEAVEPFTNDRELLRNAIERVTAESSTSSSAHTGQLDRKMDQLLGPNTGDKSL